MIATTFMVPLGISSAAAVRVGQAIGRGDPRAAATAGWMALAISAGFMGPAAVAMLVASWKPSCAFSSRTRRWSQSGSVLLRLAALFELFDGFQIVATGALRGLGDTRSPMIAHGVGYWVVGVPAGYILCFPLHWGASGIWAGLVAALVLIGVALVAAWMREITLCGRSKSLLA